MMNNKAVNVDLGIMRARERGVGVAGSSKYLTGVETGYALLASGRPHKQLYTCNILCICWFYAVKSSRDT